MNVLFLNGKMYNLQSLFLFMEENNKLFVGNLSYDFDSPSLEAALTEVFGQYGTVEKVEIPMNKVTGKIKGIAFVTMSTADEATAAKEALEGYELGLNADDQYPRPMRVDIARPMEPRRDFGGSNNRSGGYNNNNRGRYNNNRDNSSDDYGSYSGRRY
ncbi:MAG: hypothetical protein OHK0017_11010 [Patescibacteria group bacterium]